MALEVSHRREDGVTVVSIRGKATLGIGDDAIHSSVKDLLGEGAKKIVIDLAGTTSIDSSGVGELVSSVVSALRAECVILFSSLPAKVVRILEITKLRLCLVRYPTLADAVAAARGMTFEDFRRVQCFPAS